MPLLDALTDDEAILGVSPEELIRRAGGRGARPRIPAPKDTAIPEAPILGMPANLSSEAPTFGILGKPASPSLPAHENYKPRPLTTAEKFLSVGMGILGGVPAAKEILGRPRAEAERAYGQAMEDYTAGVNQAKTDEGLRFERARTEEQQAKAEQERARAEDYRHPATDRAEAKTVQVGDKVMQWNPETNRYDIEVGPGKTKSASVKPAHISYDAGIPVSVTDSDGAVYDVNDPRLPESLKPLVAAASRAHGQHIREQEESQARAFANQEKARADKENQPTTATKTMVEKVPKVKALVAKLKVLADAEAQGTGPLGARWSDFWNNKLGAPNADYSKMRVNDGLLSTALMQMHVGSRGGEKIMEHFSNLLGLGRQSPENYKAALEAIDEYADDVAREGKGSAANPPAGGKAQGDTVNVIAPDGTPGTVPRTNLQKALSRGYKQAP